MLANRALAHPFRPGYYALVEQRIRAMYGALYADNLEDVVTFARAVDQLLDDPRDVGGACATELLAQGLQALHVVSPGRLHAAHDEILEALLQLEERRGDLGVLGPHRA